jgi:hypothetical protein
MIATDKNVKRMLQQLHDAAIDCFADGDVKPYAFGLAISFITTTIATCRQLASEGRLPSSLTDSQRNLVAEFVGNGKLNVNTSTLGRSDANQEDADYRHLRNCFAHGNWQYDESDIGKNSMAVTLEDYNPKGAQTFSATIDLASLIDLTERLLVETFNGMP